MSGPKIIKRYANRKLYDTERSCYVTLEDIGAMIKAGDEVRVVDNKSGEDLTTVTFAQIIFETEKKASFMPMGLLRDLIRDSGETLSSFAREQADKVQAKASEIKETADKLRKDTAEKLHTFEEKVGGIISRRADGSEEPAKPKILGDLVKSSQKAFDELQKGVQQRVKDVTRYTHLDQEMDEISKRLAALEKRLEKMP
ncbi:MAG: polyhydroxyalkanoate synthesis regulator DNA-binding domain-containing protein [Deltaproteobacteria bacterium]|nr:polyhydroxyalkanoate synthesis regulator DNA-binding domain-containing protein [Deltaproteobacteria bacterium]